MSIRTIRTNRTDRVMYSRGSPYGSFNSFTSRKAVLSIRKCYKGDLFHHLAVFQAMMDLSTRMIRKVHNPYDHILRDQGAASQVRAGEPLGTLSYQDSF